MALENGMDIKTLSAMIGHISSETTLNIYSHITDTMQQQAAARIDRETGGTNAEMSEPPPPKVSDDPIPENATETVFEPYKPKIREWHRMRDDDKRSPIRRAVHTESQR